VTNTIRPTHFQGHTTEIGGFVVRTRTRVQTILTTSALGATVAGGLTAALLLAGDPASAAGETSTAFGVSATGADPVSARPSVSSDDAIKTASGSAAGGAGTFSASGITVKAGAGVAEATVASIKVGGVSLGPIGAKCSNGVTTYSGGGSAKPAANLSVSYGAGAGATIKVLGAGGKAVETITVAVAKCGKGGSTPPTGQPTGTPTGQPTGEPTGKPTGHPTGKPTASKPGKPTSTRSSSKPEQPAPKPKQVGGHPIVTG
jgi:hypothetical protein